MIAASLMVAMAAPLSVGEVTKAATASFVEACIDGSLRARELAVKEVSYGKIEQDVRSYFGPFKTGKFYQLSGLVEGYLLVGEGLRAKDAQFQKQCALVTQRISVPKAAREVALVITGNPHHANEKLRSGLFVNLPEKYVFVSRYLVPQFTTGYQTSVDAKTWRSLEINHLSERGLLDLAKYVEQMERAAERRASSRTNESN